MWCLQAKFCRLNEADVNSVILESDFKLMVFCCETAAGSVVSVDIGGVLVPKQGVL